MASNYTEHYQLPIWAPEDSFLREEFNESHQKIDAALDRANRYCLLKSLAVDTDCNALEINTADLDWSQYHEVILYAYLKGSASNSANIYLNGVTDSGKYKTCVFYGSNFDSSSAIGTIQMEYQGLTSGSKITFYPGGSAMNVVGISWGQSYTGRYGVTAADSGITGTNVTSMQIKPTGGIILGGGKVYLYGLRK